MSLPPDPAPQSGPDAAADGTRAALIAAGLHLFGHKGFAAASTREIAGRAGANVAAIAYHFGSKAGLRLACADAVAARIAAVLGALDEAPAPASPSEARARLEAALRAMTGFLVGRPEGADLAAFLLREVTEEGEVLDRLYDATVGPRHAQLCQLWGAATGNDPENEDTRLAVFATIGSLIYFRIGRPVILRRMGWSDMDAGPVGDILVRHLNAALNAATKGGAAQ